MKKEDIELTTEQENVVFKINTTKLKSGIKVVGKIDLSTLNQSTRPTKKTKEDKRNERKEEYRLKKEKRQRHKDSIINRILKAIDESDNETIQIYDNTKLTRLASILNIGTKHIVSFLENHPELGVQPKLRQNNKLNAKQVAATIKHFNDKTNIPDVKKTPSGSSEYTPNKINKYEQNFRENEITIEINPAKLQFFQGYATYSYNKEPFVLAERQFNNHLNLNIVKTNQSLFPNASTNISLNLKDKSFYFKDRSLHDKLINIANELHNNNLKEKQERKEQQKEQQKNKANILITTNFMSFSFYDGKVIYKSKNNTFTCQDEKSLKEYNTLIKIAKRNPHCKKSLQKPFKITLNFNSNTFTWNNNFNIFSYLNFCWEKYARKDNETNPLTNGSKYNSISEQEQRIYCRIENIEFFSRYYKIWITKNGQKVNTIKPLIITDPNSQECLQIVSKYLETRMPNDITIVFTSKEVKRLENGFKLQKYVETLKKNKEIPFDWWNRLDNREFKTLENYRKIPHSSVNKEVSYKNVYIDYLTSFQGENPLLIAYEIFNGQEEKCFVFNISLDERKSAIIYENININRATNVFIINKPDYEESMNLIFNYFTDEDLSRKRLSIRTNQNPPEKFKAIEIRTINHNNLNLWITKLNELIAPNPKQDSDNKSPEHIQFVPGLNLRSGNTERVNAKVKIVVKNLHDEIKEKLYFQLSKKYGADNVGTEVSVGQKKIDLVVKNQDSYDLYEVKTNQEVRICIREAMGQIIDYAFFECEDKVNKMTIVGPSQISQEASEYLQNIRIKHNLPIFYESIN